MSIWSMARWKHSFPGYILIDCNDAMTQARPNNFWPCRSQQKWVRGNQTDAIHWTLAIAAAAVIHLQNTHPATSTMIRSTIGKDDLYFKSPFCAIISGQSGSGKTTLLLKIIEKNKEMFSEPQKSILYCYGQYNSAIPKLQKAGIRVHAGVPTDDLLDGSPKPLLLLLDDLMLQLNNKRDLLASFFTRKSHHSNISIIFIVQNLFERNLKIVRDNSHYIFLLNSPSAALQIRSLGSQIFPGPALKYFLDAYRQAVYERKFGYLLLDLHPASDPSLRLRTNIFGESEFPIIFLPQ